MRQKRVLGGVIATAMVVCFVWLIGTLMGMLHSLTNFVNIGIAAVLVFLIAVCVYVFIPARLLIRS